MYFRVNCLFIIVNNVPQFLITFSLPSTVKHQSINFKINDTQNDNHLSLYTGNLFLISS